MNMLVVALVMLVLCLRAEASEPKSWTCEKEEIAQTEDEGLERARKTVTAMKFPALHEQSVTQRLLFDIPGPLGWDHDAIALVRAVNHLQAMGKEKAIRALREFVHIAPVRRRPPRDEQEGRGDQQGLTLLVPILFQPIDPNEEATRRALSERERQITVSGDIPFHNTVIGGTGIHWRSTAYLVDWAEKHGRLREKPLRPVDDPLKEAESLFVRLAKDAKDKGDTVVGLREHLRWQAWRMIGPLVEPERKATRDMFDPAFKSDEEWNELKSKAARLKMRWDERLEMYVSQLKP